MEGRIVNFRGGIHTQKNNQMVIHVSGVDSQEKAKPLVGKKVVWKSPAGKVIKGKISDAHGNNGLVRAIFEKGLPGQARNDEVEVEE